MPRKRTIVSAALTVIATLLVLNLSIGDKQIDHHLTRLYAVSDRQFLRTMGVILGPAMEPGNKVQALVNGDEIFPSMLEAIRAAERTVTLETYIFWSGTPAPSQQSHAQEAARGRRPDRLHRRRRHFRLVERRREHARAVARYPFPCRGAGRRTDAVGLLRAGAEIYEFQPTMYHVKPDAPSR